MSRSRIVSSVLAIGVGCGTWLIPQESQAFCEWLRRLFGAPSTTSPYDDPRAAYRMQTAAVPVTSYRAPTAALPLQPIPRFLPMTAFRPVRPRPYYPTQVVRTVAPPPVVLQPVVPSSVPSVDGASVPPALSGSNVPTYYPEAPGYPAASARIAYPESAMPLDPYPAPNPRETRRVGPVGGVEAESPQPRDARARLDQAPENQTQESSNREGDADRGSTTATSPEAEMQPLRIDESTAWRSVSDRSIRLTSLQEPDSAPPSVSRESLPSRSTEWRSAR